MKDERPIFKMFVENIGWVNRYSQVERKNKQPHETKFIELDEPIEEFSVNGEMAPITWYRQKDGMEYNGKYVVAIERFTPIK
jgi:hypothetical protein